MKVLALVLLVICSGCTTAFRPPEVRPVEVVTIEKPAPMYHPPLPPRIKSMPVEWKILTPDTMEEYLNDLKAGEAPVNAWYSLTTKGYENISNNMAQIQRYIKQVLSIVEYYRDVDAERQKQDAEPPIEE
jgi:hypothetical protein|tara:strand:- start:249 stop:638 length:390 start_codon:yes stop_codon:yes gene_type:complete